MAVSVVVIVFAASTSGKVPAREHGEQPRKLETCCGADWVELEGHACAQA
jgi:hypothetical protein